MTPEQIIVKHGYSADLSIEQGYSCFLQACKEGQAEVVKAYLELGADPDYDKDYTQPLIRAAEGNHVEVAKILLEHGANLECKDSSDDTPLETAVNWNNPEIFHFLLEHGANPNCTSYDVPLLSHIISEKDASYIEPLLNAGADPNFQLPGKFYSPLWYAIRNNKSKILKQLLAKGGNPNLAGDEYGTSLLMYSLINHEGNSSIPILIEAGGDIWQKNQYGWNAAMVALFKNKKLKAKGAENLPESDEKKVLLFQAAENDQRKEIEKLVSTGISLDTFDYNGCTVLQLAISGNKETLVEWLLQKGASVKLTGTHQNLITSAAYSKNVAVMRLLLERGANPNDIEGNCSALYEAAYNGDSELVDLLLKYKANPCSWGYDHQPAIYATTWNVHAGILRKLLDAGADPNQLSDDKKSTLHNLMYKANFEMVEMLLNAGANPDLGDEHETPLQYLCTYSKGGDVAKICRLLLEKGADITVGSRFGKFSPYETCKSYSNYECKKVIEDWLINEKLSTIRDQESPNTDAYFKKVVASCMPKNPEELKIWIYSEHIAEAKAFLDAGCSAVEPRPIHYTPLDAALESKDVELVEKVLKNGGDPNHETCYGGMPLLKAIETEDLVILKLMLENGANPDARSTYDGTAPIASAAGKGSVAMLEMMVAHGANPNPAESGWTPIMRAVQGGHLEAMNWLIEKGAAVDVKTQYGQSPLLLAVENDKVEIAKRLLGLGVDAYHTSDKGDSVFVQACNKGNVEMIQAFLDAGIDPNVADKNGAIPINIIKSRANLKKKFAALVKESATKADPDAKKRRTAFAKLDKSVPELHRALYGNLSEVAKKLIQNGADINQKDYLGYTPAHIAALYQNYDLLDTLIKRKADFTVLADTGDSIRSMIGVTVYDYLDELLQKVGIKNSMDEMNNWAARSMRLDEFKKAIESGNLNKVEELVVSKKVSLHELYAYQNPLYLAIQAKDVDMVKLLLSLGADPNLPCSNSFPLGAAASDGNLSMMKLLLKAGATIAPLSQEHSALHAAASSSELKALKFLLDNGADINAQANWNQDTALHIAADYGYVNIAKELLARGADISIQNKDQKTALNIATERQQAAILQLFMQSDDSAKIGENGDTMLHIAVAAGDKKNVSKLLETLSVDVQNDLGDTPLFHAIKFGQAEMITLLLAKGADANAQNSLGETALEAALYDYQQECAKALVLGGAKAFVETEGRMSPYELAKNEGLDDLVTEMEKRRK